jgi:hypothetical protein
VWCVYNDFLAAAKSSVVKKSYTSAGALHVLTLRVEPSGRLSENTFLDKSVIYVAAKLRAGRPKRRASIPGKLEIFLDSFQTGSGGLPSIPSNVYRGLYPRT